MTTDQWAAAAGFLLPALVAVVNRCEWKPWVKGFVALLASVAVGTVTALLAGQFTGQTWIQAVAIVFAASQAAYHTWWKGTEISTWIEKTINAATGKPAPPEVEDGTPGDSSPGLRTVGAHRAPD
jgi:hypothetical protein